VNELWKMKCKADLFNLRKNEAAIQSIPKAHPPPAPTDHAPSGSFALVRRSFAFRSKNSSANSRQNFHPPYGPQYSSLHVEQTSFLTFSQISWSDRFICIVSPFPLRAVVLLAECLPFAALVGVAKVPVSRHKVRVDPAVCNIRTVMPAASAPHYRFHIGGDICRSRVYASLSPHSFSSI
jgi:hypothetical protein